MGNIKIQDWEKILVWVHNYLEKQTSNAAAGPFATADAVKPEENILLPAHLSSF